MTWWLQDEIFLSRLDKKISKMRVSFGLRFKNENFENSRYSWWCCYVKPRNYNPSNSGIRFFISEFRENPRDLGFFIFFREYIKGITGFFSSWDISTVSHIWCLSRFLTLFLSPFKIRLSGASFFSQQAQCKPPLSISSPRATNHTRRHFWAPRHGQMTLTLKWLIENQVPIRSIWGLKVLSCLSSTPSLNRTELNLDSHACGWSL